MADQLSSTPRPCKNFALDLVHFPELELCKHCGIRIELHGGVLVYQRRLGETDAEFRKRIMEGTHD